MASMTRVVKHLPELSKFVIELNPSTQAVLEYHLRPSEKLIEFTHTVTPMKFRGQGLAQILTEHGFKYAASQHYRVVPVCTYTQHYVEKLATPTERALVARL